MKDEVDLLPADKRQKFLQFDCFFSLCLTSHAQITKSNKSTISLQYLKKLVSDEVDFLHADKYEAFLQIDSMIFDGGGQAFQKFLR